MGINNYYPQINEGDRVSASRWYNPIAEEVSRLSRAKRSGKSRILNNWCGEFSVPQDEDSILFYNSASSQIPAYGIVFDNGVQAAGGPDFVPKTKQPDIYGCQYSFYVNGSSPVNAAEFGNAQFGNGNLFLAAYDPADANAPPLPGEFWGPRSASNLLKSQTGGFRIVGVYDSTNHWALVRSWPMLDFYGQNQGTRITKGSFGTIEIFFRTPGGIIDTGQSLTSVYARFGDIAANSFVQCFYDTSVSTNVATWYAVETDTCP